MRECLSHTHNPTPYTLYGRRRGKRLRAEKSALMETLLPSLLLPEGTLDLKKLFPQNSDVWLEVGFGSGEHLAAQAAVNPAIGFIGCEPFVNGVAGLLGHIDKQKITNIRIHPDDARPVLDRLPDKSIGRCFVLFPDPWPKKRHVERRFIGPDNLDKLARVLRPGAKLRVASDDPKLQSWMQEQLLAQPAFLPAPGTQNGLLEKKPVDWPQTRYEQKALKKNHVCRYFIFVRR